MAGAYTTDLRERVLAAVAAGETVSATARRFAVGRSTGEHSKSWLFRTLRGGERPPGTTKVLMSKAILGWDGVEYHASHSQIGNRFFPQQIKCLPFKLGGLPLRKVRKSQSRGVLIGSG